MGKSIRSKREKRLRTLRRKIAEPHYSAKEEARAALLESIANSPSQYTLHVDSKKKAASLAPADVGQRLDSDAGDASGVDVDGREGEAAEAMAIEGEGGQGQTKGKGAKARKGSVKPGRRGGVVKKKVKLSKKVQRKIKKKAEFPV